MDNLTLTQDDKLAFLECHFRYWTMSSWNGLISFANNVKLRRINAPMKAYDFLDMPEAFEEVRLIQEAFAINHEGYHIGFNGRSAGYLVLYPLKGNSIDLDYGALNSDAVDYWYNLVKDFDQACDDCVEAFLNFVNTHDIVEEEVMVPTKVKVCKEL